MTDLETAQLVYQEQMLPLIRRWGVSDAEQRRDFPHEEFIDLACSLLPLFAEVPR